ncbi:MAG: 4-(cytidine 5'-diphospho)-2-C-methyl-D-erythritol kinase [Proteobacteria bacterium]|nr:4-(cytidine 5'-diphospho)-2-C-methyl-D-erythritol kinase [Pseudomonadota bacterium]
MKVLSPAKINLMLRILGQREDGYHLLQTYFQLLDWGDSMDFRPSDKDEITIFGQFNNLAKKNNLIYKAAKLLLPYRKSLQGIKIYVDKNIPQGSGLGGGSSNAGTTLRVLNKLWKCDLTQNKLQELAIKLGADVPVFVLNQSAMARGIGEQLTAYSIDEYCFVLIFPKTSVATAEVFDDKNLKRNQIAVNIDDVNYQKNWTNACLPIVLKKFSEINNMYHEASKHSAIYISGTGSTLFSCFPNQVKAKQFIQQCPSHWKVVLCQSKIIQ